MRRQVCDPRWRDLPCSPFRIVATDPDQRASAGGGSGELPTSRRKWRDEDKTHRPGSVSAGARIGSGSRGHDQRIAVAREGRGNLALLFFARRTISSRGGAKSIAMAFRPAPAAALESDLAGSTQTSCGFGSILQDGRFCGLELCPVFETEQELGTYCYVSQLNSKHSGKPIKASDRSFDIVRVLPRSTSESSSIQPKPIDSINRSRTTIFLNLTTSQWPSSPSVARNIRHERSID
jgi:hypothetical protein